MESNTLLTVQFFIGIFIGISIPIMGACIWAIGKSGGKKYLKIEITAHD